MRSLTFDELECVSGGKGLWDKVWDKAKKGAIAGFTLTATALAIAAKSGSVKVTLGGAIATLGFGAVAGLVIVGGVAYYIYTYC
jgi:hypothetical protein